jgi:hypothetical protein
VSGLLVSSVVEEPRDTRNFCRDFRRGTADFSKNFDLFVGWVLHLEGDLGL